MNAMFSSFCLFTQMFQLLISLALLQYFTVLVPIIRITVALDNWVVLLVFFRVLNWDVSCPNISYKNYFANQFKSELLQWPRNYSSLFRISIDTGICTYNIVWHTGQIFLFTSIKSLHASETNMRSISRCCRKLLTTSLWRSIMML